jgi:hypothetical protein
MTRRQVDYAELTAVDQTVSDLATACRSPVLDEALAGTRV